MNLMFSASKISMMLVAVALFAALNVHAQDAVSPAPTIETAPVVAPPPSSMPQGRPQYTDELNKESSSFVVDPDSIDPLPLKKESLKEDEEPVLEDIKSILKKGRKVQKEKKAKEAAEKAAVEATADPTAKPVKKKSSRKKISKNKKKMPIIEDSNRSPDDPNLGLEKSFNDVYNKFNATPTSEEVWGKASSKAANVYIVQKGDTLFSISKTLFGDSQFWPKIWAINKMGITNPHRITPGTAINFFPGDGGQAPTLTVGEAMQDSAMVAKSATSDDPEAPRVRDLRKQNTEFNRLEGEGDANSKVLQNIPPSFPPSAGVGYSKPEETVKIVITKRAEPVDKIPENPFLLSSAAIKTEYKVLEKDANALICKDNQYVPVVAKIETSAMPGSYNMLVQEDYKFDRLKKTYLYKVIGKVEVGADESLRVKHCIQTLDSDVLLVSDEKLSEMKPPSEVIPDTRSQIIEGLDIYSQQYYYAHQYVVLNMNQLAAKEGDDLKVYSVAAGGVVGEVRILKKTGTMGIGYILKSNDVIQLGDRVIIPE